MTILTPCDLEQLLENGKAQRAFEEQGHTFRLDFEPVIKLLSAWEWRAWTIVEVARKVNSPKNDSPDLLEPVRTA